MREITFRGKTEERGWVYGDCRLLKFQQRDTYFIQEPHWERDDDLDIPTLIIPETLGQFTGLIDKKGVKIFEGDILEYHHRGEITQDMPRNLIEHHAGAFGYWCDNTITKHFVPLAHTNFQFNTMFPSNSKCEGINVSTEHEIVGNIHDNPELIKL